MSTFICDTVQRALQAYLQTKTFPDIPATSIYKGIEHPGIEDQAATPRLNPCIECVCQDATTEHPTSDTWICEASVTVRSNADDALDSVHLARSALVFDELITETIAADLSSSLPNFTAGLVIWKRQSWSIDGRSWLSALELTIHATPVDIT